MKTLKVDAKTEKLKEVLAFLDEELEALDCDIKTVFALDLSVEEIFVNIIRVDKNSTDIDIK